MSKFNFDNSLVNEKLRPGVLRALNKRCMYCGELIPIQMSNGNFCKTSCRKDYFAAKYAFKRREDKLAKLNKL